MLCFIDYSLSYFKKLITHTVFFQAVPISESKQMEVTTQKTGTKTTSIEPGIQLINSIEQGNPKVEAFSQSIVF